MNEKSLKKILITGVGGPASIGAINSLIDSGFEVYIVGVDVNPYAYGLSISNKAHLVPYANDQSYIDKIIDIIKNERIDVFVPNTDEEVLVVSKSIKEFSGLVKTFVPAMEAVGNSK